jgi:tetrahydromethanopterin S-methyltransferase subunit D
MKHILRGLLLFLPVANLLAQRSTPSDADAAAAGTAAGAGCLACGGGMIVVMIASIVLSIALLVWVARDAKNRGMDNAVMWMILVFFTSFIGLIIYIFSRPQGNLVECPSCKNKRLQASAKCPHCGNP